MVARFGNRHQCSKRERRIHLQPLGLRAYVAMGGPMHRSSGRGMPVGLSAHVVAESGGRGYRLPDPCVWLDNEMGRAVPSTSELHV